MFRNFFWNQNLMTHSPNPSYAFESISTQFRTHCTLDWQHPRQVVYLHRNTELKGTCLYYWDHKRNQPVAAASSLMASFSALSPALLTGSIELRIRPRASKGVVVSSIFVEKDWVDGRLLTKDENGQSVPAIKLLTEI